jgi:hypothetical protein
VCTLDIAKPAIGYAGLNLADDLSTKYALDRGAVEQNQWSRRNGAALQGAVNVLGWTAVDLGGQVVCQKLFHRKWPVWILRAVVTEEYTRVVIRNVHSGNVMARRQNRP